MNKYYLMSGDRYVATFDGELNIIDHELVPLFFRKNTDFVKWVSERAIDGTRTNARILKKAHGLSCNGSAFDAAMKYNAACITDNYWVREAGSDLKYEDVVFTDDIYFRMAVSSDDSALSRKPSKTPELTNIGAREKGWKLEDGNWWLYKREPYPEHEEFTYRLGELLGFDMAYYELSGGFIKTKDFTEGKVNLQYADSIVGDNDDYTYNYQKISDISPELASQYLDIIILDVIVNNPDRHTKNYGFLTSQEDGTIISMAPNYDNDMALYGSREDDFGFDSEGGIMRYFEKFINENRIVYEMPVVPEESIRDLCDMLPDRERYTGYIMKRIKKISSLLR